MSDARAEFLVAAAALRPALHRYCARLVGSVVDGEDVVQDAMVKAVAAAVDLDEVALPPVRPWLFRIAHNRAVDVLRGRAVRDADALDDDVAGVLADALVDRGAVDALAHVARVEALDSAVSRFLALPVEQRSAVVLKDVLDASLAEIAALLDLSVDAVKGHLARGRARLRAENARAAAAPKTSLPAPSPALARYVTLFNRRDWDGLRALLADDVRLHQALRPPRRGVADVRDFFTFYAAYHWVRVAPAFLEGREVVAVFNDDGDAPAYFTLIDFTDGRIVGLRDHRYLDYIARDADLVVVDVDQTNQNS